VFHLLIPSLPVSSNREPSPGTGSEGLKGRILVVDDEDMVRSSAQKILSRQGYMTVPVENGREALNLLGTDVETFDLVLLDLTMPELSGVETLREMRRLNYTMPVILTSGYNPAKLMEELEEEGPLSFLAKPFGLADLQEKVADTMAFQEEPEMLCETVA
jgi:two-component system cell cycle sensor histidine kinase/response regulator CckA